MSHVLSSLIRPITPEDDLIALTELLHRAYAPLAARGLRYVATYQTPEVTARRLFRGHPLAAEVEGRIVGTLTVYAPDPNSRAVTYRDAGTYSFGQFGVDPEFKGRGIGRSLHDAAIEYATRKGARFMALDTAVPAADLITTYERWGYVIVERMQWGSTNFESVLMRRTLASANAPHTPR